MTSCEKTLNWQNDLPRSRVKNGGEFPDPRAFFKTYNTSTMSLATDFSDLMKLVEPPRQPLRASNVDAWDKLRQEVDFDFPSDFVNFGRIYGTGQIESGGYALMIANPLDPKYAKWLLAQGVIMSTIGDQPDRRTTRFYPENDGMVPFASNQSGDLLFLTRDRNEVVSCPLGDPSESVAYSLTFADFLIELFTARLKPQYFPNKALRSSKPTFRKLAWLR